ncbi:type II secretion system F family protein [Nocardioides sp.]|uniref:type II secretion system F family protein n=1 Tax=Nocardioides sp. TaxID=35761 RepID=UPI003D0D5829
MTALLRQLGRTTALWLLAGLVVVLGAPAMAADDVAISHVEPSADGIQILVSVPQGTEVDLDQVSVTVAGKDAPATATSASSDEEVQRTAVLAIDTSKSMNGARFEAAKLAADAYLDAVPSNVMVGIVTFDSTVQRVLEPSLDRDAARATVDGLQLNLKTRLYDGVLEAVAMAGTEGQRSILILSDGLDTSDTELDSVTTAIEDADVLVEAVALEQSEQESGPLLSMAQAGKGQLINADPEALRATFAAEADALARQILITAQVPEGVTATEAQVEVNLTTSDGADLEAQAFVPIQSADQATELAPSSSGMWFGLEVTRNLMLVGLGAFGVGLLAMIIMVTRMATIRPSDDSPEARISQFTSGRKEGKRKSEKDTDLRAQASTAAAQMLERNKSLEARIANRLESAGSALKPSEWLLVHAAITFGAGIVGVLLWGPIGLLIFLVLGALLPWLWLGRKRKKRLKAFNAGLADTLQLMSGSLSAGLSLAQSVDTIVREGSEPVTSEFKRVLVEARLGVTLEDALAGVSERMQSKDFSWVVMAIKIQREVGGNLAELLTTVAATLREREYLRRQVASLSAEGRLSAWVLGGLPPVFMVYLLLTNGDYVKPMFKEPIGWGMLGIALVLLFTGILWMNKVIKVKV